MGGDVHELDDGFDVVAFDAVVMRDDLDHRHVIQNLLQLQTLLSQLVLLVFQKGPRFHESEEIESMTEVIRERHKSVIPRSFRQMVIDQFFMVLSEDFLVVTVIDLHDALDALRQRDEVDVRLIPLHYYFLSELSDPLLLEMRALHSSGSIHYNSSNNINHIT